MEEMICRKAKS